MPDRLLHRRVAAGLLITAYVLLVGTVALGGWWIAREFADAEHDRCALSALQLELATIEVSIVSNPTGHLTALDELDPQVRDLLQRIKTELYDTCPTEYLS